MNRLTIRKRWLLWPLALVLFVGCQGGEPDDTWTPPPLTDTLDADPEADEVARHMIEFLRRQTELAAEALVTYEAPQESGQKLEFDLLQRVAFVRPDRLRWTTVHDDGIVDQAYFSDGRFALLKHPANRWGEVRGPSTIREMLDLLANEYELDIPFGDLIDTELLEQMWLEDDEAELWWVGEAWVQGHWTHHIAGTRPGVEFELWVRKGEQPFPAKLSIEYSEMDGQPSYAARFRNWLTTVPPSTDFVFNPPPAAEQIEIVPGG